MTNALTIYSQFDTMQRAATALHSSGYFKDAGSQAQAIAKVMAGAELGLPPFASMAGIHIVQGKPVLGSNVIATLVKNDPRYDYRVKQSDDTACVLEWYEDGQPVGIASFTMKEAQAAGLTGKDNWKKYPSDMLFARAISRGARRFAPGIFGGAPVYTPDEMNVDTDDEGYVTPQVTDVTNVTNVTDVEEGDWADTSNGDWPHFGDGSPVPANAMEAYDLFVAERGDAPKALQHLRNWYAKRQREIKEAEEDELFAEPTQPALVDEPANGAYQD